MGECLGLTVYGEGFGLDVWLVSGLGLRLVFVFITLLAATPRRRGVQSLCDCDYAYLTNCSNSRFVTVTARQSDSRL